jgi:CO dehydrogenase/acetyl-CoA synthase beta subunit
MRNCPNDSTEHLATKQRIWLKISKNAADATVLAHILCVLGKKRPNEFSFRKKLLTHFSLPHRMRLVL